MVTNRAAESVERLTWDEICARYRDRWVILADIAWVNSTDFEFSGAEVVATFETRHTAMSTLKGLVSSRRKVGCFWTGELGPRTATSINLLLG